MTLSPSLQVGGCQNRMNDRTLDNFYYIFYYLFEVSYNEHPEHTQLLYLSLQDRCFISSLHLVTPTKRRRDAGCNHHESMCMHVADTVRKRARLSPSRTANSRRHTMRVAFLIVFFYSMEYEYFEGERGKWCSLFALQLVVTHCHALPC